MRAKGVGWGRGSAEGRGPAAHRERACPASRRARPGTANDARLRSPHPTPHPHTHTHTLAAAASDLPVHALNKLPYGKLAGKRIGVHEGVIFCTYSSLISSSGKGPIAAAAQRSGVCCLPPHCASCAVHTV